MSVNFNALTAYWAAAGLAAQVAGAAQGKDGLDTRGQAVGWAAGGVHAICSGQERSGSHILNTTGRENPKHGTND